MMCTYIRSVFNGALEEQLEEQPEIAALAVGAPTHQHLRTAAKGSHPGVRRQTNSESSSPAASL